MALVFKRHYWVFNLLVIALCAGLAGRATARLLAAELLGSPREAPAPTRAVATLASAAPARRPVDIESILQRNIFCSRCAPPGGQNGNGSADPAGRLSGLRLQLVATLYDPAHQADSLAVIRDSQDALLPVRGYRAGETLPQGATLQRVAHGRAYLLVAGRSEYLDLDPRAAPAPAPAPSSPPAVEPPRVADAEIDRAVRCGGGRCNVQRSLVNRVLGNLGDLAKDIRVFPKGDGFQLAMIKPGSLFHKLGLMNADTIKAINGIDISSPDRALEAYTKLRSASHLVVNLERSGKPLTLDFDILG